MNGKVSQMQIDNQRKKQKKPRQKSAAKSAKTTTVKPQTGSNLSKEFTA
jgi:hypothetical protein